MTIVLPWWVSVPLGLWLVVLAANQALALWDVVQLRREMREVGGNGED